MEDITMVLLKKDIKLAFSNSIFKGLAVFEECG